MNKILGIKDIDFKGGKDCWNLLYHVNWNAESYYDKHLSEDLLTLEYDHCLIDVGWYGGANGGLTIMVIVANGDQYEEGCKYTSEDWDRPYVRIHCLDQHDMFAQLQRAIDIYPDMAAKDFSNEKKF